MSQQRGRWARWAAASPPEGEVIGRYGLSYLQIAIQGLLAGLSLVSLAFEPGTSQKVLAALWVAAFAMVLAAPVTHVTPTELRRTYRRPLPWSDVAEVEGGDSYYSTVRLITNSGAVIKPGIRGKRGDLLRGLIDAERHS